MTDVQVDPGRMWHMDTSGPVSLESEVALLGCMMLSKHVHEAMAVVTADDFYRHAHALLFTTIVELITDGKPTNTVAVLERLVETGRLAEVGGAATPAEVAAAAPNGARETLMHHAHVVADRARRRRLIEASGQLARAAGDLTLPVGTTVGRAVDDLLDTHHDDRSSGIVAPDDVYADVLELATVGRPPGAPTGWNNIDQIYTPVRGFVTVVTGIPGAGKSQWLDCLMFNLARHENWNFGVFSPENAPTPRHVHRMLQVAFGPDAGREFDQDRFEAAMTWMQEHFRWVDDADATIESILARARVLARHHDMDGLVIDPWAEISHKTDGEREDLYISRIVTMIRRFARHENVHVWLVAHPKSPRRRAGFDTLFEVVGVDGIAGGAQWNNKGDAIVSIWRDRYGEDRKPNIVDIHVIKARYEDWWVHAGVRSLWFNQKTYRYTPYFENDRLPDTPV